MTITNLINSLLSILSYASYTLTILILIKITHSTIIPYFQWKRRFQQQSNSRVNNNTKWKGKRVLVTGATSGIGEQLAKQLASPKYGALLCLTGRNIKKLNELKKSLPNVEFVVQGDLSNAEGVEQVCDKVLEKWQSHIDVAVLNAGRSTIQSFDDYTFQDLNTRGRGIMELNFFAPVLMCKLLGEALKRGKSPCGSGKGGHLLVTSSVAGRVGVWNRTLYSASKFAVNGFCEALRREWLGKVHVSVMAPGFVKTNIHANALGAERGTVKRDLRKFMTPEYCVEHMIMQVEMDVAVRTLPLQKEFMLGIVRWLMPLKGLDYFIRRENVVKVE